MQCPRCKSRTIIIRQNKRTCQVPQCFFQDQHPISFENDVRHYQGQKNGENRFSSLYNPTLDISGGNINSQAKYDLQIKKGLKNIKNICLCLKLNPKIQATAEARFITIVQLKIKGLYQKEDKKDKKNQKQKQKDKDQNQVKKSRKSSQSSKQLAVYAVYSACFQNQNFYQEYNLAKWLGTTKNQLDRVIKSIDQKIKGKIDYLPVQKPLHFIKRICKKRKIEKAQQQAMIKMCQIISLKGVQDGCPRKTVAACVFWKICQNSKKHNNIKLSDICKKYDQIESTSPSQVQKYFDTTQDTIRKFFHQKIQSRFYEDYLPYWQGRIHHDKQN